MRLTAGGHEGADYSRLIVQEKISQDLIDKLYGDTLKTSVSKLEQYRSCPFSYYLQYGLNLKEKEEFKLYAFDRGSFMHEIIDDFFAVVHEKNIELPSFLVEENEIEELVELVVNRKLEDMSRYRFSSTVKYKVLVKRLKKLISTALKYIIESIVYSDFNIAGTEVEFGKDGEFEPIMLELEDGKKIQIAGKIDRIDTAKTAKGNYVRIIDYKTYAQDIELEKVYAGIQIQLLTYIDAVCKKSDFQSAGVYYFELIEQLIKADKRISDEEIEARIRKNFKMKGLVVADVDVIQMQDRNLKNGKSNIIPAAITEEGQVVEKDTKGVQKEEFEILQQHIYRTIKQISKEMLSGKIDVNPYYYRGKSPCGWCTYKPICGFDPKKGNGCYNYIERREKDDVLEKMKQEISKNG